MQTNVIIEDKESAEKFKKAGFIVEERVSYLISTATPQSKSPSSQKEGTILSKGKSFMTATAYPNTITKVVLEAAREMVSKSPEGKVGTHELIRGVRKENPDFSESQVYSAIRTLVTDKNMLKRQN